MPKISVIVPVYKVEPYLRRCVDSILNQTFSDFELILVDDGSPDNCPKICDEYAEADSRVYVIHQKNGGLSAARNAGIDWAFANSDSQWLTFIDSDDWVHPQYLEALLHGAVQNQVLICTGGIKRVDTMEEMPQMTCIARRTKSEDLYLEYAKKIMYVSGCGKLYHKSCFKQIRYPVGKQWEDLATTYKIILSVPTCAVVDQVLYFYFNNDAGIVRRPWTPKRLDEFEAYEAQLAFFASDPKWNAIYEAVLYDYIKAIGYSYFKLRDTKEPFDNKEQYEVLLRKKIRKAMKAYPGHISFNDHIWIYETAYPRRMNLYWHLQGLLNKVRKK